MKTKTTYALMAMALLVALNLKPVQAQLPDLIEMGPGYANEVFYSFDNGVVKTSPRTLWDIAFYTNSFSAGIVINDGAGVELYTYPDATADGWDTFDTIGMSFWPKMFNDASEWENGAFNRNQKGHPDYGWGVYSSTTHDVIGDSLFLVKTQDGIYRKLNIIRKYSSLNQYEIRFALLDGTQDTTMTLDVNPYNDRVFMAFSFTDGIVDREPLAADWDILFTKYMGVVQNTPYPVVGVLSNPGDSVARVAHTDPAFNDWSTLEFSTVADTIGYDWKYFDMNSFQYVVEDSLMYFVKTQNSSVYKLAFDSFDYMTGTAIFNTTLLSALGVNELAGGDVKIFPNPASSFIQVSQDGKADYKTAELYDLSGKLLRTWTLSNDKNVQLDVSEYNTGLYLLRLEGSNAVTNAKVMLQK